MNKYRFKSEQRYAIWLVYDKKCSYCKEPLDFKELTIDHIIPESLLNKPSQLNKILKEYGLDDGSFSINNYCNWVPAHNHCNQEKSTAIYDPSLALIKALASAKEKAKKAQEEEKKIIRKLENSNLFGKFEVAFRKGKITKKEWKAKIELDCDEELSQLKQKFGFTAEEAIRKNDAIVFLRTKREYETLKKLAEEQKDLKLAYVEDVFFEKYSKDTDAE